MSGEFMERKGPALYPQCEECGAKEGIKKAIVGPADEDGMHPAKRYELHCGHVLENPSSRFESGIVTLFQLQHPEFLGVEDDEQ